MVFTHLYILLWGGHTIFCQDRYLIPSKGGNHGTLMILDGFSCCVFIHFCRVILSSMVEPYCGQSIDALVF